MIESTLSMPAAAFAFASVAVFVFMAVFMFMAVRADMDMDEPVSGSPFGVFDAAVFVGVICIVVAAPKPDCVCVIPCDVLMEDSARSTRAARESEDAGLDNVKAATADIKAASPPCESTMVVTQAFSGSGGNRTRVMIPGTTSEK
jgi:hypothetical protein